LRKSGSKIKNSKSQGQKSGKSGEFKSNDHWRKKKKDTWEEKDNFIMGVSHVEGKTSFHISSFKKTQILRICKKNKTLLGKKHGQGGTMGGSQAIVELRGVIMIE